MEKPRPIQEVNRIIADSLAVKQALLKDEELLQRILELAEACIQVYREGGKMLLCGNGGSAADAQHIAAELSGRFYYDREPLDAEALHVNTSYLTAVGNDYSYDEVYARMVRARGHSGDILVAISTSGNSPNVLNAANAAKAKGMLVAALTGHKGGKLADLADYLINIPSNDTPRIQEAHILVGHILCELIEAGMFPRPNKD
ncbi:MAG: SIS domain-containing protein [Bacteroidales bacterium]|nr:SIS domain-containing protein [Bacteroidales bacterium]